MTRWAAFLNKGIRSPGSQLTTTNQYDANGNLFQSSTPLAGTAQTATTTYTYDPVTPGDLVKVTDPDNNAWQYAYDHPGVLDQVTDPAGDVTTYNHDNVGRLLSAVSPK